MKDVNELLEEAHLDISAWIKFLLDEGYQEIILQGHSLGTIKVIRYLFEGEYKNKISKLILLAPFEKHALPPDLSPLTFESCLYNCRNSVNSNNVCNSNI